MDVSSRKHLAIACQYLKPDGSWDTVLLNDREIPNESAQTGTNALKD